MSRDASSLPDPPRHFATTRWSIVLAAGRKSTPDAAAALQTLCRAYWFPLYAYVRRQGHRPDEAQDLTQSFFLSLLERNDLAGIDPGKGRFRSFLLAGLKHFLCNEWDRERARKRGGGRQILSLDFETAESRLSLEPADHQTPYALYERQWALTLLDRVRQSLRSEQAPGEAPDRFDALQVYLTGSPAAPPYAQTADRLGMSEAAVKMAVHRLRRRFQQRLRQEVAQTLACDADVDDEIRSLVAALQRTD
jgi:DNA-directed RNA polymerase specialized sigma24 family protein